MQNQSFNETQEVYTQSSQSVERYLQLEQYSTSPPPNHKKQKSLQINTDVEQEQTRSFCLTARTVKQYFQTIKEDKKEPLQNRQEEREEKNQQEINAFQTPKPQVKKISSILKLQDGKFSNKVYMQPIKQKIDSLNKKNNQSSRSTSPKHYYNTNRIHQNGNEVCKNLCDDMSKQGHKHPLEKSFSFYKDQPKQKDIVLKNIKNSGKKQVKPQEKKDEKKQSLQNQPSVKQIDQEKEQAFLETVDRLYQHEKKRKDALKKSIQEKFKNETNHGNSFKPLINQRSQKILNQKLKSQIQTVKQRQENNDFQYNEDSFEEDLEYYQSYQYRDKQVQVNLIEGLTPLRINHSQKSLKTQTAKSTNQAKQCIEQRFQVEKKNIETVDMEIQTDELIIVEKKNNIKEQFSEKNQLSQADYLTPIKEKQPKRRLKHSDQQPHESYLTSNTQVEFYIPIHQRYEQVLKKKENWVKSKLEEKKLKEDESQSMVTVRNDVRNEEEVLEFFKEQMSWYNKKNEQLLTKKVEQDKKTLECLTFKPQVNPNKCSNNSEKVEDRLLQYQIKKSEHMVQLESKYLPNFKPNLQNLQNNEFYKSLDKSNLTTRSMISKSIHESLKGTPSAKKRY